MWKIDAIFRKISKDIVSENFSLEGCIFCIFSKIYVLGEGIAL